MYVYMHIYIVICIITIKVGQLLVPCREDAYDMKAESSSSQPGAKKDYTTIYYTIT